MMRLKYAEVKTYREKFTVSQAQRCALCEDIISDDAVLDHDHTTGKIRRVLHRGCNAMLGKIENNLARNKLNNARLTKFTMNLMHYINSDYDDVLHPTFKTKEERKMRAYKKKKKPGPGKKY